MSDDGVISETAVTGKSPFLVVFLCLVICSQRCLSTTKSPERPSTGSLLYCFRYEGVCDIDLLKFYVPLLQMCVHIWWTLGRDKTLLDERIDDLRRKGHRIGTESLLQCVLDTDS